MSKELVTELLNAVDIQLAGSGIYCMAGMDALASANRLLIATVLRENPKGYEELQVTFPMRFRYHLQQWKELREAKPSVEIFKYIMSNEWPGPISDQEAKAMILESAKNLARLLPPKCDINVGLEAFCIALTKYLTVYSESVDAEGVLSAIMAPIELKERVLH